MTPTNPHKEYVASRVAAATPMELTRMLYESAVQSVREALAAHGSGDILARGNAVTKAVQILGELRFSLRRDVAQQYCDTLSGLYGYLQNRLIQAHAEKSERMLQESMQLVQTLLDGWIGAMENLGALESAKEHPEPAPEPAAPPSAASTPYASPYSSHSSTYSAATPEAATTEAQNRSWEF